MNEGKRPIAGWAWMLIGIAVIAYTKLIEWKTSNRVQGPAHLTLFFWIGVIFIAYGALREFLPRIRARPAKKELVGPPQQQMAQHHSTHLHPGGHQHHGVSPLATHQHVQSSQHPSHPYTPLHKPCPRCHQTTAGKSRFCHNCGHQFF